MKRFERPSFEEFKQLVQRLQGKTIEEMISIFGPPARVLGSRTDECRANGVSWTVEIRRVLIFRDVGPTIRRLVVRERADGKFEFSAQGKEIIDEQTV